MKEVANLQPSPETFDTLKRDAIVVSETLTKLADDTWSKGSEAASTILALPTSQAVVANTASALHKLEGEARKTICAIANDPRTQDVAVHLQKLDQDASAALEQALAHPTAIAARGQVELLSKGASETYEDFLRANPAARDFAKAAEQAGRGCVGMCQEQFVLCGMLAAGLVEVVLPGTISGLIGFGRLGPGKGTIAAEVQRSVYGGAVAKESAFAGMQSWGMAGMQGLLRLGWPGQGWHWWARRSCLGGMIINRLRNM